MDQKQEVNTAFRKKIVADFQEIQTRICEGLQALDGGKFVHKKWQKEPGEQLQGSGEMAVLRGSTFEKAGVNFSNVHGKFSDEFAKKIPGAIENEGNFWACGVSVVVHASSPLVPTVHMNIRRIETSKCWFGGGSDLTPTIEYKEDNSYFHSKLRAACEKYETGVYTKMRKDCDEYFHIKHWNEPRGVGGIFFDNLNSGDNVKDFNFVKSTADAFIQAYAEIVSRRKDLGYAEAQKEKQYLKRAKYVEFNLLYDRGTKFGFMTGGNPEAILMSMPPVVKWP